MAAQNEEKISPGGFVHLHVHTEYSLLDGASRVKELVRAAKKMGMEAIAITDHGNMYGVIDFYRAAKAEGINPIIGCEFYLAPESRKDRREIDGIKAYHLILLAENETGYKNLSKLASLASIEGFYYKPRIDKELLREYHEGLICLSACVAGEIPSNILRGNTEKADELLQEYVGIFGRENFFVELQDHGLADERKVAPHLIKLAKKHGVGLVVTNDVHYIKREDSEFHDVLLCIQTGKTVDDPDRMRFGGDGYYLKSAEEMAELFAEYPEAVANTVKIAKRCKVDFTFGELKLPHYPIPAPYKEAKDYLRALCEEKIESRYSPVTDEAKKRLDYELSVINRMGYDGYFLIVWDFIAFAKRNGIAVGPGRGSAAGSIVAYILGITDIDPLKYALLFERFLNPERVTMPDIDIDFCYIRREEVIEYVKERYGSDHVAQIVTFGTMAAKGAIRDVGRALNMPYGEVAKIAKLVPNELKMTIDKALAEAKEFRAAYDESAETRRLVDFARCVEGLPRHSSTHAAGIVIAPLPLTEYLPVQTADGTLITQYDKDHVEELGLLKMDFLGLRTLTVIADTVESVKHATGETIDVAKIPDIDEKTAKMLSAGKTGAVFQMESAGMTNLVKELAPDGFSDLIPTVALYRPGPLGSGMVEDFIAGRRGKKTVKYLHPLLEPILKETFGVVLYQEQVMQTVQVLAGFTLGQADILRRAMGKKKQEILMAQKENFLQGCAAHNVEQKLAANIFELLLKFADYGFNKSHSAAYALVAWQTAYLKAHYPAHFMAAMLTSVMDTDKVPAYIDLAKRMNLKILPPDINASRANFSVDKDALRFGLAAIKGVGENAMQTVIKIREEGGAFSSLFDFCSRIPPNTLNVRAIEKLIKCGAFDSLKTNRRQLLAITDAVLAKAAAKHRDVISGQIGLFGDEAIDKATEIIPPDLEEAEPDELLRWEKEITGFYITGHPLEKYGDKVRNLTGIEKCVGGKFADRALVRVAGLITETKRINTKRGEAMCIAELEDFTERIEVTVFPKTFYENADILVVDSAVAVQGRLDADGDTIKLIADKIWPLDEYRPEYYLTVTDESVYDALREIFGQFHGSHIVHLNVKNRWKKIDANYWLDGSKESLAELAKVLGDGKAAMR